MSRDDAYTLQLQNGQGLIEETRTLLELWQPGVTPQALRTIALNSGRFSNITARRLRNVIYDCFAPRYLASNGKPATHLKRLLPHLSTRELSQFFFLFTCRAHPILADFVRDVYWEKYASGYSNVSNEDARSFVLRAIEAGRTQNQWSAATVSRAASDLTGCCADYGLLSTSNRSPRRILPFRISPSVAAYLAYDLHSDGTSDSALLDHPDWQLFGLKGRDTLNELKNLSLMGFLIIQVAGDLVRITWKYQTQEELCDVLAKG